MGINKGSSPAPAPEPVPPPPDPMAQVGPLLAMMMAMSESSSVPEAKIPDLPEPYRAPFRNWDAERAKLRENLTNDQAKNPRQGRASTVLTSLLERPDGSEDTINAKAKLGN